MQPSGWEWWFDGQHHGGGAREGKLGSACRKACEPARLAVIVAKVMSAAAEAEHAGKVVHDLRQAQGAGEDAELDDAVGEDLWRFTIPLPQRKAPSCFCPTVELVAMRRMCCSTSAAGVWL